MAIDAYVGKPRSGKSYSVVKQVILPSLKEGRHVYTNIPLTDEANAEFPGMIHQLDAKWFEDVDLFDKVPNGACVVLDEVWRRWPKGMTANQIPKKDKAFLAEHGHLVDDVGRTTRVILVTQDLDQLSNFCLTLIDKTYHSVKLDALGASGKFRVDIYDGSAKGERPPKSRFIRSVYDSYSQNYWKYYKSATKSQTDNVGDESRADKRANIWRSPLIWGCVLGSLIIGPLAFMKVSSLFSTGFGAVDEDKPAEQHVVNPPPTAHSGTVTTVVRETKPVSPPAPVESLRWRIGGHIKRKDRDTGKMVDVAMLVDGKFVTYLPLSRCEPVSVGLEYRCMFQGEWVTPWSGPRATDVSGAVLSAVPFVGGERSEQAGEMAQQPVPASSSIVNPPPAAL
jgi:zona occludens toxin